MAARTDQFKYLRKIGRTLNCQAQLHLFLPNHGTHHGRDGPLHQLAIKDPDAKRARQEYGVSQFCPNSLGAVQIGATCRNTVEVGHEWHMLKSIRARGKSHVVWPNLCHSTESSKNIFHY